MILLMSRSYAGNGKPFVNGGVRGWQALVFDFSFLILIALHAIVVLQTQIML
jgi:hypothetical protein